jgi:hypothetical protein
MWGPAGLGGTGALTDRLWPDSTIHDHDLLVEKSAPSVSFPADPHYRNCWRTARSTPS